MRISRDAEGRVVFLEKGSSKAGLARIEKHAAEFADQGIKRAEIPDVVMEAATHGRQVGKLPGGRPVFEIDFKGKTVRIAVDVGDNGFVVGANPVSVNRRLK